MNFEKRSKKNGGVEISRASDGLTTTWRCPVSSSSWSSRLADCLFNIYRPSRERGRDTHCVRVGVQRRLAGCTWRRGRDFPLFSVKFSAFMYSTGFMSYSTVYWVDVVPCSAGYKFSNRFDMYLEAARHIHVLERPNTLYPHGTPNTIWKNCIKQ